MDEFSLPEFAVGENGVALRQFLAGFWLYWALYLLLLPVRLMVGFVAGMFSPPRLKRSVLSE